MCFQQSRFQSLLSSLNLQAEEQGRREEAEQEDNPGRSALPHTQSRCAHLAAPEQDEGCGEREERGTPGVWPALGRAVPSLTKTLGPVSSRGLCSGVLAAKWVFNIYLKERVGTKNELQVWEQNHTFVLLMLFPLLCGDLELVKNFFMLFTFLTDFFFFFYAFLPGFQAFSQKLPSPYSLKIS